MLLTHKDGSFQPQGYFLYYENERLFVIEQEQPPQLLTHHLKESIEQYLYEGTWVKVENPTAWAILRVSQIDFIDRQNNLSQSIDEEWLEDCNWYLDNGSAWTHQNVGFYLQRRHNDVGWNVFIEVYNLGIVKTRENLLSLCQALGINLNE